MDMPLVSRSVIPYRTLHENTDTDNIALEGGYGSDNVSYRAAAGENVIDNQDSLFGTKSLTTPESPSSWFCPLGEDGTCAKLSGNLKSEDDAPGGWAGDKVNTLIAKMVGNHAA